MQNDSAIAAKKSKKKVPPPIWMVSFVYLVSLMLTFFVLLFSMSSLDIDAYKRVVSSIDITQQERKEEETVKIKRVELRRQVNLDYLAGLLEEHVKNDQALRSVKIVKRVNEVAFVLPLAGAFSGPSSRAAVEPFKNQLLAIGGLFANVTNKIEARVMSPLSGQGRVGEYTSGIELGMARGIVVANALKEGGVSTDVAAMYAAVPAKMAKVEVVIMGAGRD